MACLADMGFACECGARRLATAPSESGRVMLCPQCVRAYLLPSSPLLAPPVAIPWSVLELEVQTRTVDLLCFEWIRAGVPWQERRTLLEPAPRRFRIADRVGTSLGLTLAVLLVLVVCRAVFS